MISWHHNYTQSTNTTHKGAWWYCSTGGTIPHSHDGRNSMVHLILSVLENVKKLKGGRNKKAWKKKRNTEKEIVISEMQTSNT